MIKVEPYWNVNLKTLVKVLNTKTIKVEPYWNVNTKLVELKSFLEDK